MKKVEDGTIITTEDAKKTIEGNMYEYIYSPENLFTGRRLLPDAKKVRVEPVQTGEKEVQTGEQEATKIHLNANDAMVDVPLEMNLAKKSTVWTLVDYAMTIKEIVLGTPKVPGYEHNGSDPRRSSITGLRRAVRYAVVQDEDGGQRWDRLPHH